MKRVGGLEEGDKCNSHICKKQKKNEREISLRKATIAKGKGKGGRKGGGKKEVKRARMQGRGGKTRGDNERTTNSIGDLLEHPANTKNEAERRGILRSPTLVLSKIALL